MWWHGNCQCLYTVLPLSTDEHTRVALHREEGVEGSDYINANYITVRAHRHAHTHTRAYTHVHSHTLHRHTPRTQTLRRRQSYAFIRTIDHRMKMSIVICNVSH